MGSEECCVVFSEFLYIMMEISVLDAKLMKSNMELVSVLFKFCGLQH